MRCSCSKIVNLIYSFPLNTIKSFLFAATGQITEIIKGDRILNRSYVLVARWYLIWSYFHILLVVYATWEGLLMVYSTLSCLFFYQLFGCPEASFGPWLRGSCPHPILITALFQVRLGGHWESLKNFGSQSPYECISIARTANLPILSATCYPSVPLSPKSFEVLPIFNDEERPT